MQSCASANSSPAANPCFDQLAAVYKVAVPDGPPLMLLMDFEFFDAEL